MAMQVIENVQVVVEEGAAGVFIINHDFDYPQVLPILRQVSLSPPPHPPPSLAACVGGGPSWEIEWVFARREHGGYSHTQRRYTHTQRVHLSCPLFSFFPFSFPFFPQVRGCYPDVFLGVNFHTMNGTHDFFFKAFLWLSNFFCYCQLLCTERCA